MSAAPDALDITLPPPRLCPTSPARCASTRCGRSTRRSRSPPASSSPPGRHNGTVPGPLIRATERHSPRPLRECGLTPARSTSTGSTRRTWTASSRSSAGRSSLRVRGGARRDAALPLPCHPVEEAHSQGALRRLHHRPEGPSPAGAGLVMVMNGSASTPTATEATSTPSMGSASTTPSAIR